MSDDVTSSSDVKPRRAKAAAVRTINNNLKFFKNRRRNRSRKKFIGDDGFFALDGEGVLNGKDGERVLTPLPEEQPRQKPQRQYSREELIELMTHPLSSVKHPSLENSQNKTLVSGKSGVRWLEDRWDHRKHTDSLTDEDRSDGSIDPQKKRMNDPKTERLRKEQDVVLSPQRRSFNSGCFVNQPLQSQHSNAAGRRPESPLNSEREVPHRDIPARRIGSGRIIRDPMWDYRSVDKDPDVQNVNNHDYNYRQRDDRFDRRSYERSHDNERPQQRNSRYNNNNERKNNKYQKHEPEEPEWFSGGPTSQHDTIELHGFEGPQEDKTPPSKRQNKNAKISTKAAKKSTETVVNKTENSGGKKPPSRKSSPEVSEQSRLPVSSSPIKDKLSEPATKTSSQDQDQKEIEGSKNESGKESDCLFDFEDILNFDSLPPILSMTNGYVDETSSGSRFSQFFRRESTSPKQSNVQRQDSRQSSDNDDIFNSIINDITNTNISIPLDGDTYFAPISPAASSVKEDSGRIGSASLLEMLQKGGKQNFQGRKITKKPSLKDLEACGKIHSVEELEARLRQEQGISKPSESSNRSGNKEEELAAFRKLMMAKQNSQDQKPSHAGMFPNQQNQQQPGMNQQQQPQQGQMPIPHDLVLKLLHVQQLQHQQRQHQQHQQQEVFAKLLAPPNRFPPNNQFSVPPPLPPPSPEIQMHINNAHPSKELLQRPEAQNIIRRLKRGETTIHHLIEQLKRSVNMQPIHREMIASIIKLHSLQPGVHQRDPSPGSLAPPVTSEHMLHQMIHNQHPPQHQHPLPQPPQQLRIPSPHANAAFGPPPVVSPNLQQNSTNSLTVQPPHPVLQRVPSPRELVAHTQNILQNALLKKKLEEQKENYRKRQELQSSLSPNPTGSLSPCNLQPNTTSPTPLAFTPTSVLRKMTAEKDGELVSKQLVAAQQQIEAQLMLQKQAEMIISANGPQPNEMMRPKPFRQLPNTWNLLNSLQGRPIVKGNNNFSVPPPVDLMNLPQFKAQHPQMGLQRSKQGSQPLPPQSQQHLFINMNHNNNPPPTQQPGPRPGVGVRNMGGPNMIPPQQQSMNRSVQQLVINHNYNGPQQRNSGHLKPDLQGLMRSQNQMVMAGRNYQHPPTMNYQPGSDGSPASPVSNQLARWFSPELLAQARAGKLPDMPPLSPTQNMLSVEELERLQQAVHN